MAWPWPFWHCRPVVERRHRCSRLGSRGSRERESSSSSSSRCISSSTAYSPLDVMVGELGDRRPMVSVRVTRRATTKNNASSWSVKPHHGFSVDSSLMGGWGKVSLTECLSVGSGHYHLMPEEHKADATTSLEHLPLQGMRFAL